MSLAINDGVSNKYLNTALETSRLFNVTNGELSRVNFGEFNDYQLIILNEINSTTSGLTGELTKGDGCCKTMLLYFQVLKWTGNARLSLALILGVSGIVAEW
ncbi:MAG: hypothetical protein IPM04_00140 [Saprospiraceae bacterium]|nr:hypothetical protein [Candidatus Brachybacter algidus]MBK8746293.1 hypothetical protein [Candidatus Brachybacter algidus]